MTLWSMRVSCWMSKATRPHLHTLTQSPTHARAHTHKCVICITSLQQQWFCERASMLRYTYIVSLVPNKSEMNCHGLELRP